MTGAGLIAGVFAANGWLAAARRRPPSRNTRHAPPHRAPVAPPLQDATRDELYELAQRLDIHGRSRMSKAELEQAVAEHTSQAAPA